MAAPQQTNLPDPPAQLKAVQSYMRIAQDVDRVDPVVAYWLRLYSTESSLKIDKDSAECKTFLVALLSWLEKFKQSHKDNETVTNQTVGQAHYENFALALFNKVDALDRAGTANKNTVRMFFMASVLFEAMAVFGTLTDEVTQKAKYAKFKAAYIQKCLKTGQTPKAGPIEGADLEGGGGGGAATGDEAPPAGGGGGAGGQPPSGYQQMPQPGGGNPSDSALGSGGSSTEPASGGSNNNGGGGLFIPEVPKDNPWDSTGPAAAIIPPKPTDPFILTPSVPPPSTKPTPQTPAASTMPQHRDGGLSTLDQARFLATNGKPLKPEDIVKGQKYCKFANSALQYDDIPTAVANLQKALMLLTTGQNPD